MARRSPSVRDTHRRLLVAGLESFAANGYSSTSVDDIVERAGTTRGAFYYYFSSKADLARDLHRELWEAAARRAQETFDPDLDIVSNFKRALDAHLFALGELGLEREFLREGFTDPTLAHSGDETLEWGATLIRDMLMASNARGELQCGDVTEAAAALTTMFESATFIALDNKDVGSARQVIDDVLGGLAAG